ncbi:MAG: hypothetical protein VXY90_05345, partial [Pseudomonadota bacterium]|nr:hypothetical protein [Pseudomonadota bacterium]
MLQSLEAERARRAGNGRAGAMVGVEYLECVERLMSTEVACSKVLRGRLSKNRADLRSLTQ